MKHMKDVITTCMLRWTVLALVLLSAACTPLAAGDEFTSAQRGFIYNLYSEKQYFQCVAETERLVQAISPGNREPYDYFMAVNYFRGYQYSSAIFTLQKHGTDEMPLHHSILVSQA